MPKAPEEPPVLELPKTDSQPAGSARLQLILSGAGSHRSQVSHPRSGTTARTPSLTQTHVGSG
jgi:hypothetical protein